MFGKKYVPVDGASEIPSPEVDVKSAKRVGQYKISEMAIYKPDGTYLPLSEIEELTHDRTSVHVSGCCAGGVPVERIIFDTANGRYPFIFDTVKDVENVISIANKVAR